MDSRCFSVSHSNITRPGFCPQTDSSGTGWMRTISQGQGHGLGWFRLGGPFLIVFIWNSHNIKSGLTGSMRRTRGGCNRCTGAEQRWMDRFSYWTLISTFWVIKFIIWLAATLACDYRGYPTEGGSMFNFPWEQRSIAVGHLSLVMDCGKKEQNNMEAFGVVALAWDCVCSSPFLLSFLCFFSPPFLSPSPSKHFLPDSFVCQDPGYHGYQLELFTSTSSLI